MATAIVLDSASRRASIINSRKTSIVSSLASDAGPFEMGHVKSGSVDIGRADEGSVCIVSVGDGSVNPGFVGDNSDQDVFDNCGIPRKDEISERYLNTSGDADKTLVMDNEPLEEPMTGWPSGWRQTESGETKLECISSGQNQRDETQIPAEKMTSVDVSKESDSYKMSMRDYLMALSIFFLTFLTYGNFGCLPVLTVEWLQDFKDSKSLVLYVPNLASALMSAAGVIDGFLISRFGVFNMIILGCFLQISCVIGSYFITNAITLVIVLGFLLGIGSCFCYLNCFILMGLQFGDAGKSFIAALSLAGPLAGVVFPNLIPVFIEQYTWRGGMLILAGIDLHLIPFALFLLLSQKHKKEKQHKDDAKTKAETDPIPVPAPKKTFDVSVFKDPLYLAYVCAVTFTLSGTAGVGSLFPSFMHKKGLVLKEVAELFSIYRIVAALPRGSVGLLLRRFKFRFIYIFIVSASLFGLVTIFINQAVSNTAIFISTIVLSLCMGTPSGLYPIGTLECVGQEKYSFAESVIETSYGVGIGLSGYLAGLLVEYMDSYQETFCIFGATIITTNLCLLVTVLVQYWRGKKGFTEL